MVGAVRERLPRRRKSNTFSFRVADCEGYVTVGEYDDGRPGEVFMKVSKQGSTLAGIMDAFSISVSLGLQHGVPLSTYVRKYTNMRFEPAGITDDPDLRIATSLDGLHLPAAGRRLPATRGARGARRAVHLRAHAADPARRGGGRHAVSRTSSRTIGVSSVPPSGLDDRASTSRSIVTVDLGFSDASRRAARRTAVLPVRHGHAARGLLLRVHELRDNERLFVM